MGGGGIKWPVQDRWCFFRDFTWTGHFIEAFFVGEGVKKGQSNIDCVFFNGFPGVSTL